MERIALGFAIPVGVIIVVFIIIFGFSRLLLVFNDQAIATAIALFAAVIILGGAFALSMMPGSSGAREH